MTETSSPVVAMLPHALPELLPARALLLAMRRIAIGGLDDAQAASVMMGLFGLGYRRPLTLVRALMHEVSRVANRSITIAPCCCTRMTANEHDMLRLVMVSPRDPFEGRAALSRICGADDALPALSVAQALSAAFGDLGRPLEL